MLNTREMSSRYLLCRPRGGLNDTFCQIERCWHYAEQFDRHLIIDTHKSALHGDFSDYFEIIDDRKSITSKIDQDTLIHLNTLECRPHFVQGRLDSYVSTFDLKAGFIEVNSNLPVEFERSKKGHFENDFNEPLLIHDNYGGGDYSFNLLKRVRLSDSILLRIRKAIESLPIPYDAVHIRNTDYRTNYQKLFRKIRSKIHTDRLLVCSDDPSVIEYAKNFFDVQIVSFDDRHQSIHPTGVLHDVNSFDTKEAYTSSVIHSFIDLLALANADRLFLSTLDSIKIELLSNSVNKGLIPLPAKMLSGYSRLAKYMFEHKSIIDQWLGLDTNRRNDHHTGSVTIYDLMPINKKILSFAEHIARFAKHRLKIG
jgi:hypothetical protein